MRDENNSEILQGYRQNLKDIFYAARKKSGLTQTELSEKSGVSQGNISKYENGLSIPEAPIFIVLCNSLNIPYDCLAFGFIDQMRLAKPQIRKDMGSFRLPKKYSEHCVFNVRGARPWLELGEKVLGRDEMRKMVKSHGVNPAYLVNMDNQINEQFLLDLRHQVKQKKGGNLSTEDLFGDSFNSYDYHGNLHHQYAISKTGLKAVDKYLQNAQYYSCSYERTIEKKTTESILVNYKLNDDLKEMPEEYLNFYRQDLQEHTPKFLEKMALYGKSEEKVTVDMISQADLECSFQISVA